MASCQSCGAYIPEDQGVCSMCYGDPYYGYDGNYINYLMEIAEEEAAAEYALQSAERSE